MSVELDLWDEYTLNEIRAKKDTLRQLLSVNVLLIGAYSTILFNSLLKTYSDLLFERSNILKDILKFIIYIAVSIVTKNAYTADERLDYAVMPIMPIVTFVLLIFLLSPIGFWFLSIRKIMGGFTGYDTITGIADPDGYSDVLADLEIHVTSILTESCRYIEAGLGIVIFFVVVFLMVVVYSLR